jgi:hypothetical protein
LKEGVERPVKKEGPASKMNLEPREFERVKEWAQPPKEVGWDWGEVRCGVVREGKV